MKRLRTFATVLSLIAIAGLPLWSAGCGGQYPADGNGGAAGNSTGSGTTPSTPEAGSTINGGTDVPGVLDSTDEGSSEAPADE